MKVLTKDTKEQFEVRPANDYDVKNGHAITDLEILDDSRNNSSAWLKSDECFILTETGHKVEYLNSEQTEKLEEIYDAETDERVKDMIARVLAARYRRDYRPNKREGETKETKMAKVLENVINNCGFSQSKMAKHFCDYAHRYLDQSLFEGFIRQYVVIHAWKWRHSKPERVLSITTDATSTPVKLAAKLLTRLNGVTMLTNTTGKLRISKRQDAHTPSVLD